MSTQLLTSETRQPPSHDYRRVATLGIVIIVITFGVFGLWAALAPLNSAAVAPGTVTALSRHRTPGAPSARSQ